MSRHMTGTPVSMPQSMPRKADPSPMQKEFV